MQEIKKMQIKEETRKIPKREVKRKIPKKEEISLKRHQNQKKLLLQLTNLKFGRQVYQL